MLISVRCELGKETDPGVGLVRLANEGHGLEFPSVELSETSCLFSKTKSPLPLCIPGTR